MLEVRNLCKTYKGKGKHGVTVKALDNVSCTFPKTGMIFLLGKSGSGKSTLLNMIGGLDKPDSGEIIIKGKNSKDFSGSDFDSYRNTYIGFIFQEYNILNEFNIEQNISLALQLQGKPNDKAAVEKILKEVDLAGLGKRKPNTLSGGQKQRVAIARALIKSPEIIMADEPSGALDSKTGKQVFDTLKKLSEEKLVIVVSHDRDFAEIYGDRIIELSDGKIISDITKKVNAPEEISENISKINDHTVVIKDSKKLTKKDVETLLETLKSQDGEAIISSGERDLKAVKEAIRIRSDNSSDSFVNTEGVEVEEYDGKKTKFIRSRLPMARAFKTGVSGLKTKPVRLIFTNLLTTASLVFFGLTSALMLFKPAFAVTQALQGTDLQSEAVQKQFRFTSYYVSDDLSTGNVEKGRGYENSQTTQFGKQEVKDLNSRSSHQGLSFAGVYVPGNTSSNFIQYYSSSAFYKTDIQGFIEANNDYINNNGFSFEYGAYPTSGNQIAISKYIFEGLKEVSKSTADPDLKIEKYSDLAGKVFGVNIPNGGVVNFEITGVINTGTIPEKYYELAKENSEKSAIELKEIGEQFVEFMKRSYYSSVFVNEDFYDDVVTKIKTYNGDDGIYSYSVQGVEYSNSASIYDFDDVSVDTWFGVYIGDIPGMEKKSYLDLNYKSTTYVVPKENEIYAPLSEGSLSDSFYLYHNRFYVVEQAKNDEYPFVNFPSGDEYNRIWGAFDRLQNYGSYYLTKGEYQYGESYDNDLTLANNFLNKFYLDAYKYNEARELGEWYRQGYASTHSGQQPASFVEKLDRLNGWPHDFSVINDILNTLKDDRDLGYHYARDYYLAMYLKDNNPKTTSPYYQLITNLKNKVINRSGGNSPVTQEEFNAFLEMVNDYGSDNTVHFYEYDIDKTIQIAFSLQPFNAFYRSYNGRMGKFNVIGYIIGDGIPVFSREFLKTNATFNYPYGYNLRETQYVAPEDARYDYIISKSTYTRGQIDIMLTDGGNYYYTMMNSVYQSLQFMLSTVLILSQVFLYLGIGFGTFAALMLLNFISQTISAKTKDIGILRAVGARGSDLFKIFFSESGLIALICLAVAIAITIPLTIYLNGSLASTAIAIQIFDFGLINIGIMVGGALLIALIGTIIPVAIAAKKPPVESIRTL